MCKPRLWHIRAVLDDGEVYEATIEAPSRARAHSCAGRYALRVGRQIVSYTIVEKEAAEVPVSVEVRP